MPTRVSNMTVVRSFQEVKATSAKGTAGIMSRKLAQLKCKLQLLGNYKKLEDQVLDALSEVRNQAPQKKPSLLGTHRLRSQLTQIPDRRKLEAAVQQIISPAAISASTSSGTVEDSKRANVDMKEIDELIASFEKDESRHALELKRKQYQDIQHPDQQDSSALAKFVNRLRKRANPDMEGIDKLIESFEREVQDEESRHALDKKTQDEIKWAFRNAGCEDRSEAVQFLMDNPAIFSKFDANTNQMLIDVALNMEPDRQRIAFDMRRPLNDMYEARLVLGVGGINPRQEEADAFAKAPASQIGRKPTSLSAQQLAVLQEKGLTDARSVFRFLIESPVFALCDAVTCQLLMEHAGSLQVRDGSVSQSDIDKAQAAAKLANDKVVSSTGIKQWPVQSSSRAEK